MLLTALSSLALNASREGASTTSLGNLFQCLTTLTVKNFLIFSLNLSSSLKLLQQCFCYPSDGDTKTATSTTQSRNFEWEVTRHEWSGASEKGTAKKNWVVWVGVQLLQHHDKDCGFGVKNGNNICSRTRKTEQISINIPVGERKTSF